MQCARPMASRLATLILSAPLPLAGGTLEEAAAHHCQCRGAFDCAGPRLMSEILFLCHRVPFPPDRGDKIRSWNILRRLAQIAPVHVAAFADDLRDRGLDRKSTRLNSSH